MWYVESFKPQPNDTCPKCLHQGEVERAYIVETTGQVFDADYRCLKCGFDWIAEAPLPLDED